MARKGELTVSAQTETELGQQPKGLVWRRKEPIAPAAPSGDRATEIEELTIAFDDDLRSAIIARLVRDKALILEAATQERQISEALELARLEAVERARDEGIKNARAEIAVQRKQKRLAAQKTFIDVELPQLLDTCDYLGYEIMQQTINGFAKRVGVKLEWRSMEDGQFECIPSII